MVSLEISAADAALLVQQLNYRLDQMQSELVHTDDRALHRALIADLDRLKSVRDRVADVAESDARRAAV